MFYKKKKRKKRKNIPRHAYSYDYGESRRHETNSNEKRDYHLQQINLMGLVSLACMQQKQRIAYSILELSPRLLPHIDKKSISIKSLNNNG